MITIGGTLVTTVATGGSVVINRPSPYGDHRFIKWTRFFLFLFLFFFWVSVGLTYEQSAVKLVVRVLKSGTI